MRSDVMSQKCSGYRINALKLLIMINRIKKPRGSATRLFTLELFSAIMFIDDHVLVNEWMKLSFALFQLRKLSPKT